MSSKYFSSFVFVFWDAFNNKYENKIENICQYVLEIGLFLVS